MNGEMSRNEKAAHYLLVGLAYMVYCAAVIYGDLMFLQVVSRMFSNDPLLHALSFGGAVMTAASAMLLPIAKIRWLMPGAQMLAGWVFWFVEIALLAANAALAYSISTSNTNELISLWRPFSPATPMVAVVGWGILFMLDPRNKMRHAVFEGFADQVDQYSKRMREITRSGEVQKIIDERALYWAKVLADDTIPRMLGIPEDVIRRSGGSPSAPLISPDAWRDLVQSGTSTASEPSTNGAHPKA